MRPRAHVRRLALVGLLGLVVAVAGCGEESADVPGVDEVQAMLLDTGDVMAGWQLGPPVNDADLRDSVQVPCDDAVLDPGVAGRLQAVTGVQFEPADGSSAHLIEFARTGEPDQLAADLDAFFAASDACGPTVTDEGGSVTIEDLAMPAIGDQRRAAVLRGVATSASEVVWWGRAAHVRVGPVAVTLGLTEVVPVGGTPAITDEEFLRLVETAVARISGTS